MKRADNPDLTEAALQRAIVDAAACAIISTDLAGRITSFNVAAQKLLGWRAEELVGKATPEVFHLPAELAARAQFLSAQLGRPVAAGFEALVAEAWSGLRSEAEWTYRRKDGSLVPVLLSVTALRDDSGIMLGFVGLAADITERRQTDAKLQEHEAQYQQQHSLLEGTLQATADGILVVSREGLITSYNRQFLELWRVPREILEAHDTAALAD